MSLELEVLVADEVVVRSRIASLQAADASGRFGLLPAHQAFITLLAPCIVLYREEDGREHYVAADGGVLLLEDGRVSLATREAVAADRLEEVADAAATMLAARRQREQTARAEFTDLQTALLRELGKMEKRT